MSAIGIYVVIVLCWKVWSLQGRVEELEFRARRGNTAPKDE